MNRKEEGLLGVWFGAGLFVVMLILILMIKAQDEKIDSLDLKIRMLQNKVISLQKP